MNDIPCKRVIVDILDYLKYKVLNDDCTIEELRSISNTIEENLDINCTAKDIARIYGQSERNVHNVLSRNRKSKPKRRVYYNFAEFLKFIPKTWRRSAQGRDVSA